MLFSLEYAFDCLGHWSTETEEFVEESIPAAMKRSTRFLEDKGMWDARTDLYVLNEETGSWDRIKVKGF